MSHLTHSPPFTHKPTSLCSTSYTDSQAHLAQHAIMHSLSVLPSHQTVTQGPSLSRMFTNRQVLCYTCSLCHNITDSERVRSMFCFSLSGLCSEGSVPLTRALVHSFNTFKLPKKCFLSLNTPSAVSYGCPQFPSIFFWFQPSCQGLHCHCVISILLPSSLQFSTNKIIGGFSITILVGEPIVQGT